MTSPSNPHTPSPDFKEYLARDVARSLRYEARFAPSPRAVFARRLGLVALSGAGTVVALAVGLVFGNSTGYASARVEGVQRSNVIAVNTFGVTTQLAMVRADLGRARSDLTRLVSTNAPVSPSAIGLAESNLKAIEARVERIEVDLAQGSEVAPLPPPRSIPMQRALALTCDALVLRAAVPPAQTQQGIPVVALPPATARTTIPLGMIAGISSIIGGVREVPGGKVLVNDPGNRQLRLFDTSLTTSTLLADSTPGTATSYGRAAVPLIRYRGDSSIMADLESQSLLVLDGRGQVARAIAPPDPYSFPNFAISYTAADNRGRLLYRGNVGLRPVQANDPPRSSLGDSLGIVRADLESRRIDTVGRIKVREGGWQTIDNSDPMRPKVSQEINPLPVLDDWVVLSDGSVAFVRGRDYHIDWIRPDGSRESTPKMPFDWRRLTDEDKQKILDSARTAQVAQAVARALQSLRSGSGASSGRGRGGGGDTTGGRAAPPAIQTTFVPPSKMTDFYPPIRRGAVMADLDANLWILPTTSAQSQTGELVYDVVNLKGELYRRVRLPAGRSIVGFGNGGVVYLMAGDRATGFYLERTRLPR